MHARAQLCANAAHEYPEIHVLTGLCYLCFTACAPSQAKASGCRAHREVCARCAREASAQVSACASLMSLRTRACRMPGEGGMLRCKRCLQAACGHAAAHQQKRAFELTSAVAYACSDRASAGERGTPSPLTCRPLSAMTAHENA
eukprot:6177285-Pleurochrysis_carterae.AAC.1